MSFLMTVSPEEITDLKQRIVELVDDYHQETDYRKKYVIGTRIDAHRAVLQDYLQELPI